MSILKPDSTNIIEYIQSSTYHETKRKAKEGILGDEYFICFGMQDGICGHLMKDAKDFDMISEWLDYELGFKFMFRLRENFIAKYGQIVTKKEIMKAMMQGHKLYEYYD